MAEAKAFLTEVPTVASKEDLKTVGFDARFPHTNQTKNCWQNYVDFHKCIKIKVGALLGENNLITNVISSVYQKLLKGGKNVQYHNKRISASPPSLCSFAFIHNIWTPFQMLSPISPTFLLGRRVPALQAVPQGLPVSVPQ